MPFPLALIPLIAAAAGATATGVAGATNKDAKTNRGKLKALEKLEQEGKLGLTDQERRVRFGEQDEALRTTTTQQFNDLARMEAATGGASSAADIERRRFGMAGSLAEGARRVARDVEQASMEKADDQRAEMEARSSKLAKHRAAVQSSMMGTIASGANAAGKMAGGPPEEARAAGPMGGKIVDPAAFQTTLEEMGKYSPDEIAKLISANDAHPQGLAAAMMEVYADPSIDPELHAIITAGRE